MNMQTFRLIPVWKPLAGPQRPALPRCAERILTIGASAPDLRLLKEQFPAAVALSVSGAASVAEIAATFAAQSPFDHLVWIAPFEDISDLASDALIAAQQRGVLSGFKLIQALLQSDFGTRPLALTAVTRQTQAVHSGDRIFPAHASVHGLMGSVAKEYPQWRVRVVDIEHDGACPFESLLRTPADPSGDVWAHRHGIWYRRELLPYEPADSEPPPYREDGVYVLIGGAGGLGEVWTEHLIRARRARVIWIGRRELNAEIQSKLTRLQALGPAPEYIRADACSRDELEAARAEILRRHGRIDGIVHAAIVLRDTNLPRMTQQRFEAALRAKVDVSVRMLQVFGAEPLDFVLFFSSLMSFGKAAGQSNYAAGCAFKDAYAQALSRKLPGLVKTLNWGFWGSVGVVASQAYRTRMASFGLGSIEPDEGMAALDALCGGPMQQMAYLKATWVSARQALRVSATECLTHFNSRKPQPALRPGAGDSALPPAAAKALGAAQRREVDHLLITMLHERLKSLGLSSARHRTVTPQYERWLEESLRLVREHESARSASGGESNPWLTPGEMRETRERYSRDREENPALAAQLDLVERMLQNLEDILSGRRWAVEVLFPRGSIGGMSQVYHRSPIVDYFNDALGAALLAYVDELTRGTSDAGLRILEIGAGTGTSTAPLLGRLAPLRAHVHEYLYTDISQTFLRHGAQQYSEQAPFLKFALFDVERPPAEQSLQLGQYDIVVAANVLHATKDIRGTLRHTKALLRQNGVLLMNELVANSLIAHLTFGLTPGWWLAEDAELRLRGGPGLTIDSWRRVLGEEGFGAVEFPAAQGAAAGMQIITALSDGLVRRASRADASTGQQVA